MGYAADYDIGRSVLRRVEVIEVDDKGPIQKVTVMGLADEIFELPLRGQPHGLTTVPTKGAIGYVMMANGRPDQAFLMGLEHPDLREKFSDRKPGESTMYAEKEQEIFMDKDGNTFVKTPAGKHRLETDANSEVQAGADHVINTGGMCLINCG